MPDEGLANIVTKALVGIRDKWSDNFNRYDQGCRPITDCHVPQVEDFPTANRDGWRNALPYEFRVPIWAEAGLRPSNFRDAQ